MYISLDDMARLFRHTVFTYIAWMNDRRGLKLPRLFMDYMGWRMEGYFWLRLSVGVGPRVTTTSGNVAAGKLRGGIYNAYI